MKHICYEFNFESTCRIEGCLGGRSRRGDSKTYSEGESWIRSALPKLTWIKANGERGLFLKNIDMAFFDLLKSQYLLEALLEYPVKVHLRKF